MTSLFRFELLRFVAVGCVNTGFSYSLYAAFLWAGLHFAPANLLAFMLSLLFSFRMQGCWVFGHHSWRRLWRFILAWCVIYLFNIGVIALFLRTGVNAYSAGALALAPVTLLSYAVQKLFVFAGSREG